MKDFSFPLHREAEKRQTYEGNKFIIFDCFCVAVGYPHRCVSQMNRKNFYVGTSLPGLI